MAEYKGAGVGGLARFVEFLLCEDRGRAARAPTVPTWLVVINSTVRGARIRTFRTGPNAPPFRIIPESGRNRAQSKAIPRRRRSSFSGRPRSAPVTWNPRARARWRRRCRWHRPWPACRAARPAGRTPGGLKRN